MNLADFVEQISNDFQSTFTLAAPNVMANMFFPHEQERVAGIIKKYLPNVEVKFHLGSEVAPSYFIHFIEVLDVPAV